MVGVRSAIGLWHLHRYLMPNRISYVTAISTGRGVLIAVAFSGDGWRLMRFAGQDAALTVISAMGSANGVDVDLASDGSNVAAVISDAHTGEMEFKPIGDGPSRARSSVLRGE